LLCYRVAAQQLAAADPAGVRKVGRVLPAGRRENGSTVARAAGQLSSRPFGGGRVHPGRHITVSESDLPRRRDDVSREHFPRVDRSTEDELTPSLRTRPRALAIAVVLIGASLGCQGTPHPDNWYANSIAVSPSGSPHFNEVTWSPDGNALAASSAGSAGDTTGSGDLFVIDLLSGDLARVTFDVVAYNAHPTWSAAGDRIAFYSNHPREGIWTVNADGTDRRFLANGRVAAWAPSGDTLAVADVRWPPEIGTAEAVLSLVSVHTAQIEERAVFHALAIAPGEVAWSPDGGHIAAILALQERPHWQFVNVLYLIANPADEPRELARGRIASVQWLSPQTVMYAIGGFPENPALVEFRAVDVVGACRQLTLEEGSMTSPHFSPAGDALAFADSDGIVYVLDLEALLGPDFWSRAQDCD